MLLVLLPVSLHNYVINLDKLQSILKAEIYSIIVLLSDAVHTRDESP